MTAGGKRWRRRLIGGLAIVVGGFALFVLGCNLAAKGVAAGRLHESVLDVPPGRVGVVFGTTDTVNGRENLYFRHRIDAAAELWKAGRVSCLIVSGDNRSRYYNEPQKMRRALVEAGVPGERIVCDYAGLRTLDSVVRAKEVFGVDKVVFVSQRFQNERAVYIAQAKGMDACGYNAPDVEGQAGWRTKVREIGARVKMWLDVNILGTRPRHLGEQVELPIGD